MLTSSSSVLYDYNLFKSFKKGDKQAFREIYIMLSERTRRSLLRKVANTCRTIPDSEVDDMMSEAFYRLFIHREALTSMDHLKAYLFTTCKTLFVDLFRERSKKFKILDDFYYEQECDHLPAYPVENMAINQIKELLDENPKLLGAQQRRVFELFFFECKNAHEIAKIMGKNKQTILNHKSRALEILKSTLGMQMTEDGPVIYSTTPVPQEPKVVPVECKGVRGWKTPVRCKETGVEYRSVSEAAKHLKCQVTSIIRVLKNQYTNTRGYTFELIE